MSTHGCRALVAVFDTHERVERAAAELLATGHAGDHIHISTGIDTIAEWGDLMAAGMTVEARAYYESELRAGRWLLVVSCRPSDVAGVLGAIGRHGGSVRVPPEIRDGRV